MVIVDWCGSAILLRNSTIHLGRVETGVDQLTTTSTFKDILDFRVGLFGIRADVISLSPFALHVVAGSQTEVASGGARSAPCFLRQCPTDVHADFSNVVTRSARDLLTAVELL
ncbi:hypothetical protein ABIA30_003521 [Mycobacterium sp. MAA66]|uniref:hypothetical protein n=1 Tax=Mycobacterium sp. MAA66 TaxID=3156297 RepID=UPI0035184776